MSFWISRYNEKATSYWIHQFFHACIDACMNSLKKVDDYVNTQMVRILQSQGFVQHPMDSSKIIQKDINTGKLTVRKLPETGGN
jgi:copper homeostasis protein CutC